MSRVRENRMHGSMGGSWKRSGQAVETGDLRGAPRGSIDPRRSLIPATSPAPYPTTHAGDQRVLSEMGGLGVATHWSFEDWGNFLPRTPPPSASSPDCSTTG